MTPMPTTMPEPESINAIGLTPDQHAKWKALMELLSWKCPGFTHLFYKLLACNTGGEYAAIPTRDIPVAATDQKNIMINPDRFFTYTLKEMLYILAHEIVHNIYNDVIFLQTCAASGFVPMNDGTKLPFRNDTMQKAMDYRINALLRDARIGSPPSDALLDDQIAKANDSVTEVYKRVYEDEEKGGKRTGGKIRFDQLTRPGLSTPKQSPGRNDQQWQVEVAMAQTLEAANRKAGQGMGSLDIFFKDILEPEVVWTDHIRGIFNRKVGSGSYNWKRPNRRLIIHDIYAPSRSGNGAGWVVCWGDSSGSCIRDVNKYLPEMQSILEDCKPQRLTVIWCDAGIQRIDELEDAADLDRIRGEGAPGGGGTSVKPVFDWIANHTETPEVFIGFTDGEFSYPKQQPPIPVIIWAMVTERNAPWGEVVRLNPKKGQKQAA